MRKVNNDKQKAGNSFPAFNSVHISLDLFLIAEVSRFIETLSLDFVREILLFDIVVRIAVGIFIPDPFADFFVPAVMCILQVNRYSGACAFYGIHCGKDRIDCGITLRGACHIGDCLRENDL